MQIKQAVVEMTRTRIASFGLPRRARTLSTAETMAAAPVDLQIERPPDLDEIAERIRKTYSDGSRPTRNDLKRAAWCLWETEPALASEARILPRLMADIESTPRKGTFRRFASVYLVSFPLRQPGFVQVAESLARLASVIGPPWSVAHRELALFQPHLAPERIATFALQSGKSPSGILQDCGITNVSKDAGIIEAAFLSGLHTLREEQVSNPLRHLERVQQWALDESKGFTFEQHRGKVVDSLILPLAERAPPKSVLDKYLSFVVTHFGDPRLHAGRWVQMARSAQIVRGWLTDLSLRQFLDVLDDAALEHQWRYRRAFWEAVHKRGLIAEAWVVFDRVGADRAKLLFDGGTPFARWQMGPSRPIERGQGCLLLRIGQGIIAEWSHNGRCHIWHDRDDPTAPKLLEDLYNPATLRLPRGASSTRRYRRSEFTHHGSDRYAWQAKVADEINEMTGRLVHQREYEIGK